MKVDVILGLQWGDEGKGKIVDALAPAYDIIARFQGGPNAGHTIIFNERKFVLHTVPSGIFRREITNVIGNGVVLDPVIFCKEIDAVVDAGFNPVDNLIISGNCHLIMPSHRLLDAISEAAMGDRKIGSTLKGIGPTYTDKYARKGLRAGAVALPDFETQYQIRKEQHFDYIRLTGADTSQFRFDGLSFDEYEKLWFEAIAKLKKFRIVATEVFLNNALKEGKRVLSEGAQGTLLDIDFGSYPFVTSSNTTTGGVCTGLGIAPQHVGKVFGIFKAYCTRVGNGPFPTELNNDMGELIRKNGNEFGSTTGRPRRTGWLDLPALRYAIMINGVTDLVMTKADVLTGLETIQLCNAYKCADKEYSMPELVIENSCEPINQSMKGWSEDISKVDSIDSLPLEMKQYLNFIEMEVGVVVSCVSTGPDRNQIIKI
jgi:adenylosuccinate synthase